MPKKKVKIIKIPLGRKKSAFQIKFPSRGRKTLSLRIPSLKVAKIKGLKLPKELKFKLPRIKTPSIRIRKLWT